MQCRELEYVLESEGLGPLPADAREHLAGCAACQDFLADLSAIVVTAKSIPAEVTPPDRLWISLRARLEAEGLIKESVLAAEKTSWLESLGGWLRPRTLATAAAGLVLLVTAVFVSRTPNGSQVKNTAQIQTAPESSRALQTPKPAQPSTTVLAPSPSETASITLMQAERDVPNMQLAGNSQVDASLRDNLRTLNAFIADCEQHLKQNPQDELAREYLYTAYQQKAQLLTAMMESGRSEH